jgi:acetyl-CoA carboxylase beta subunit
MGTLTQNIVTETITAQTTYSNKTSIAVLNSHATDGCRVQQANGTYVVLASGQSLSLNANSGNVLPDITILTDDTNLEAQIVAS